MRNLKRALSLALAAAMLISLMVVGASAADYGDQDKVTQTEAVDVLTGLGIVGGDQNGNFNPDATLTRAEFCVMISNALNSSTFDPTLFDGTETPFTDVAGHWGANYIAYCYSAGIIAGTSATTFSPDATLTAAQAAAILLMALGYNQDNEFAANGQFSLNVTSWAQRAGLYQNLSVAANAGISRESTAKMIFNALTYATPVDYNQAFGMYNTVGNGIGGVVNGDTRYDLTLASKNFDLRHTTKDGTPITYTVTDTSTSPTYSLASGVSGHVISVNANEISREGYVWYMENDNDDFVAVSDVIYTDTVLATVSNGKDIANWTAKGNKDYVAEMDNTYDSSDAQYIVNNASATTYAAAGIATLSTQAGVIFTFVDNDANGKADLVYVSDRNVYTVSGAPTTRTSGGETIVNVPGVSGLTFSNSVAVEDVIGYEGLVKDDVVLVYQDGQSDKYYIEKADTLTGALTAIKSGDYTIAGTAYKTPGLVTNAFASITNANLNKQVQIWLDNAGYVVKVKEVEAAELPYALVLNYDAERTMAGQMTKLVTTGGQIITNNVDFYATAAATTPVEMDGSNAPKGTTIVQYELKDGVYKITKVAAATATDEGTLAGVDQVKNGTASLVNGNSSVVANADTLFILVTAENKASVYTGIANVPSVKAGANYAVVGNNAGVASVVFASNAATESSSASDIIYVFDIKPSVSKDGDTTLYTYTVVKEGAIITETFSTDVTAKIDAIGVYQVIGRDTNQYATDVKDAEAPYNVTFTALGNGSQAKSLSGNTLVYDTNSSILVDENTKVFSVNKTTGALTEGVLADIQATTTVGQEYSAVKVIPAVKDGKQTNIASIIFIMNNVVIPVAEPTSVALTAGTKAATVTDGTLEDDNAGTVTAWTESSADQIKVNVTAAAGTTATIKINGVAYTNNTDYTLTANGPLTVVVTVTDTATSATQDFTYTITVSGKT